MTYIRRKAIEGLKVGDMFSISRIFAEKEVVLFADITRDYNPIHFDNRFTEVKGFSGRICHGLLVASMISEIGGQIGWLATEMNFSFRKTIYFGDKIVCNLTITDIDDRNRAAAKAEYINQEGTIVMEAILKGIMPGSNEKDVMRAMIAEGDPTNKAR
jgi:3-hydroxybutyryl-CoA dehydratase